MQRPGIKSVATALWAAVNVGLVIVIGYQTGWGEHFSKTLPTPAALPPEMVKTGLLDAFSLPPLEDAFTQTLARPLFVPTRRPAPPAPAAGAKTVKQTMKKGQFDLTGTMILKSVRYAVLREKSGDKKTHVLKQGDTVDGILVKQVDPERVVLTQYGDTETLTMKVQPSPKGVSSIQPPQGSAVNQLRERSGAMELKRKAAFNAAQEKKSPPKHTRFGP